MGLRMLVMRTGIVVLSLLLPLTACSGARTLFGKTIDGEVVDAETGQPIAGAYVYYLYEATVIPTSFTGHNSRDICYHASAAVTDAQGRYHLDAWEKREKYNVNNREPTAWGYARGYVPVAVVTPSGLGREPEVRPHDVVRLAPSRATGDVRLDEIWDFVRPGCFYGGISQRSLYPGLKAALDEAITVATTPAQVKRLEGFRYRAASVQIAPDPVADGGETSQQIEAFMRKNLQ